MILVKDVLKAAAALLGMENRIDAYLSGDADEENTRLVEGLLGCFHFVESEIALDYLPLITEEEIVAKDGRIEYASLSNSVAYIAGVFDGHGNRIGAKRTAKFLEVPSGKYLVRYAMIPKEKTLDDCCDYQTSVSERLLAYGVAAEYCLHKGMYAENAAWDKKYRSALCEIYRGKGGVIVKARSWI